MKRFIPFLALLAVSCARFPGGDGVRSQYPRITFTTQLRGEVNDASTVYGDRDSSTEYLYYVAIRVLATDSDPERGTPPVQVIGSDTPNGYVAGSPTHVVEYRSNRVHPYRLLRFFPGDSTSDPDNPINLSLPPRDTTSLEEIGPIQIISLPGDSANHNQLSFTIFLNQLATPEIPVESIRRIQVNFLTMNRLSTFGAGFRSWDALGNGRDSTGRDFVTTINVDVRSNRLYDNNSASGQIEPVDDVPAPNGFDGDPSLDIQNFSVEVNQP